MRDRVDLEAQQIGHRATSMLVSAFLTRFEPMDVARRIALTLAADTTATECGKCPMLTIDCWSDGGQANDCRAFRQFVAWKDGNYSRLPECIQAEVK